MRTPAQAAARVGAGRELCRTALPDFDTGLCHCLVSLPYCCCANGMPSRLRSSLASSSVWAVVTKIISICKERIRQIEEDKKAETKISVGGVTTGRFYLSSSDNLIVRPQAPTVTYSLNKKETEAYQKFSNSHYGIHGDPKGCSVSFRNTAVGIAKTAQCNVCNEKEDITDYSGW